jgi:chemotaxis methyl-accepting protein methylase
MSGLRTGCAPWGNARPILDAVPNEQPLRLVIAVASAGGLQALRGLLATLRVDERTCVLVVMHQPMGQASELPSLLQDCVQSRVIWVEDGAEPLAGCVQVVPTGVTMVFDGGAFRRRPAAERAHSPFDELMRQLADRFGDRCHGVVLSGAGSDGAQGAAAVVAAGGLIYAQTPSDAAFAGMPQSVVSRGLAAMVGSPRQIAEHLNAWPAARAFVEAGRVAADAAVRLLGLTGGPDFRLYKPNLLVRRMEQRALGLGHPSVESYITALEASPAEVELLRQDLLIAVTSSFRDPGMWEVLTRTVIEPLLRRSMDEGGERRTIRAWVAACATGEEAYTLVMILADACREAGLAQDFQVIATDVDQRSIEHARKGLLTDSAVSGIPERLRDRWLVQTHRGFMVSDVLRKRVLFGLQDLLSDPPFGNIDLLCCRNLLIYLNDAGQRVAAVNMDRAISDFGVLVLGQDETLPDAMGGWQALNARHRIYRAPARSEGRRRPLLVEALGSAASLPSAGASPWLRFAEDPARPVDGTEAASVMDLRSAYESLQCVNEELQTLNDELRAVNLLLEQSVKRERDAATKLHGLMAASSQPLLVINSARQVEHFSTSAMRLFRLRDGDEGRVLSDFANDLCWPELDATLGRCVSDGGDLTLEVQDVRGGHWLATMAALGAAAPAERKVLLTLSDVTRLRDAVRLQAMLDALPQQIAVLDTRGRIEQVNRAWRAFGLANGADSARTDVGVDYLRASAPAAGQADDFAVRAGDGVRSVLSGQRPAFRMCYPCATLERDAWFALDVAPLSRPEGGCIVSHTDVTEWLCPAAST